MTRAGSLKRLAIFGSVVLVSFVALYVPTLSGGSPWSWHIGAAPGWVWFVSGLATGLIVGHFTWPTTSRWPELEREVAEVMDRYWQRPGGDQVIPAHRADRLRALVRPHVLKREGR